MKTKTLIAGAVAFSLHLAAVAAPAAICPANPITAADLLKPALAEARVVYGALPAEKFRVALYQELAAGRVDNAPDAIKRYSEWLNAEKSAQELRDLMASHIVASGDAELAPPLRIVAWHLYQCENLAARKSDQAASCWQDIAYHAAAAHALQAAHAERAGWEISVSGQFGEPKASGAEISAYVDANTFLAEFASIIEDQIADTLSASTLQDREDGKAKAVTALFALPSTTIAAAADVAWNAVLQGRRDGLTLATSWRSRGIEWMLGESNYLGASDGWTIKRGKELWFGQGYANGKKRELSLMSAGS